MEGKVVKQTEADDEKEGDNSWREEGMRPKEGNGGSK